MADIFQVFFQKIFVVITSFILVVGNVFGTPKPEKILNPEIVVQGSTPSAVINGQNGEKGSIVKQKDGSATYFDVLNGEAKKLSTENKGKQTSSGEIPLTEKEQTITTVTPTTSPAMDPTSSVSPTPASSPSLFPTSTPTPTPLVTHSPTPSLSPPSPTPTSTPTVENVQIFFKVYWQKNEPRADYSTSVCLGNLDAVWGHFYIIDPSGQEQNTGNHDYRQKPCQVMNYVGYPLAGKPLGEYTFKAVFDELSVTKIVKATLVPPSL